MVQPVTIRPDTGVAYKLGDEDAGDGVLEFIRRFIAETDDRILHHTTFDYGWKTMALTLQGIILTDAVEPDDDGNPSVTCATYGDIVSIEDTGHDREIRIRFHGGNALTHRMGNAQTVDQLKRAMRSYQNQFLSNGDPQLWGTDDETQDDDSRTNSERGSDPRTDGEPPPISERVRFWEEQDRINQALIPRVIRQNELLAKHIAEHDDLPELIGRVISDALSEQATLYNAAMERAATEMKAAYAQELDKTARELEAQYAEALEKANSEQMEAYEDAISTVQQESGRTRKWAITLAAVAIGVAATAIIIAVLL